MAGRGAVRLAPPGPVDRRLLDWLAGVVAGRPAPPGPGDGELTELILGQQLAGLAVAAGAADPHLAWDATETVATAVRVEDASEALVGWLAEAGIPCVTLRGPALAALAWGDVATRRTGDVDLLVAPDLADAARDALLARGCVVREQFADWFQRVWHFHHQLDLPDRHLSVELHWDVTGRELASLPIARMIAEAEPVACQRAALPALSLPWQLVTAAAHAVSHWFALKTLLDVAFVTRRLAPQDRRRVVAESRAAHVGPMVYLALEVSAMQLGWALPAEFTVLRGGSVQQAVAARYLANVSPLRPPTFRVGQVGRVAQPLMVTPLARWPLALPLALSRRSRLAGRLDRAAGALRRPPHPT
jgi:hypothetical protein